MRLMYGIEDYLKEADNIYDLVGNCFGALCDNIDNHQLFIGEYIDEVPGEVNNPNIKKLNEFSEKIMRIIDTYKPSAYQDTLDAILRAVDELVLNSYHDDKKNQLTVIYCILTSIDAVAVNWNKKWMTSVYGPLDKQCKTRYRVYFNNSRALNSDYASQVGRDRTRGSNFFEQFESFRFIDSGKWKNNTAVPVIKFLSNGLPQKDSSDNALKLKIAVIPLSCQKNFEFKPVGGSGLRVDYSNSDQTAVREIVLKSLDKAINEGSNFIVLPEYVISPFVHESVCRALKEYSKSAAENSKLIAVFEGTTWREDDNNVMKILDAWGEELGEYYKFSPFTKKKSGGHGFSQSESLRDPGKICDLLAVDDIGLFLPVICRDAIDGEYTEELMKMLFPTFAIISAWSPSVASFEAREKEFAGRYFTSAVFADACSSVKHGRERIGNGCIVHKVKTIAGASISYICRNSCKFKCEEMACVYIVEFDFTFNSKVNTSIRTYKI